MKLGQRIVGIAVCILCYPIALAARYFRKPESSDPRIVWGSISVINFAYWSSAMKEAGFKSTTFTSSVFDINQRSDWDRILDESYGRFPRGLKNVLAFASSIWKYDVFCMSFHGFFLGRYAPACRQAQILRLARRKSIILPFGGDGYVYKRIASFELAHALQLSYPGMARRQKEIENMVDYWCEQADVILPATMAPDGLGRWDLLSVSNLVLPINDWTSLKPASSMDGTNGEVVIVHSPNHREFKGTEFVLRSVQELQDEGLRVRLVLLEKIANQVVRNVLTTEADILVEQLLFPGYGLNAVEGMASGLPTISNLSDDSRLKVYSRWTALKECPLVSATPETLTVVLRDLVTSPHLRGTLGAQGRRYVEKHHSFEAGVKLFSAVLAFAFGERDSLANLDYALCETGNSNQSDRRCYITSADQNQAKP